MRRILLPPLFLAVGLLALPGPAHPVDITVSDAGTFQSALDYTAGNGDNDVITVMADISVSNTLRYVASESRTLTIVGAGTSRPVLSGVDNQIMYIESLGGAITIRNLMFQNGNSTMGGGAVHVQYASGVTIDNCYFYQNRSDGAGGAAAIGGSPVTLTGNTFDRNTAGGGGGGCSVSSSGAIVLNNNYFLRNQADGGGGGANLSSIDMGSQTLTNNRFVLNKAGGEGSGLHLSARSSLITIPVRLTNNSCSWESGTYPTYGGTSGFYVNFWEGSHVANVYNNIVWHINAGGTDLVVRDDPANMFGSGTANIFNNFYLSRTVSLKAGGPPNEGGNITSGNPGFVDYIGGNLHLLPTSPAIDNGTNSAPALPATDFEGDARIVNGTVDIGADEFVPTGLPDLSVSPASHAFPDVVVMQSSTPLVVTVSNTGDAALNVTGISLADTTNFTLDLGGGPRGCGTATPSVPPGDNCTVTVTFNPQTVASFGASLTITSNDPPDAVVSLSGNGVAAPAPNLSWSPDSLDFGSMIVGNRKELTLTLTNTGTPATSLVIGTIELYDPLDPGSDFYLITDGCSDVTLAVGESCSLVVRFSTIYYGQKDGSLVIPSNDPDYPAGNDARVSMTGYSHDEGGGNGCGCTVVPPPTNVVNVLGNAGVLAGLFLGPYLLLRLRGRK